MEDVLLNNWKLLPSSNNLDSNEKAGRTRTRFDAAADKNQAFGNLIQGDKRRCNIEVHFTTTASISVALFRKWKNRKHRLKSFHIFGDLFHNRLLLGRHQDRQHQRDRMRVILQRVT